MAEFIIEMGKLKENKSYASCESYINCYDCKEKYWLQEVE